MAQTSTFPAISESSVEQVKVLQGSSSLLLKRDDGDEDTWKYQMSGEKEEDADGTAVSALISQVSSLAYNGYLDYNCQDMTQYGLEKPAASITIDYTENEAAEADTEAASESGAEADSETETEIKKVPRQVVLYVGGQDESGNYYVKISDSNEVHTMSESMVKSWLDAKGDDFKQEQES